MAREELPQGVQVLLPDGLIGPIGGADVGDLLRAQAQLGVQELDQHGVARQQLQQDELLRAQQLLAQGQDAQQVMAELAHRLTNKLIHSPTEALRQAGESGDRETLAILSQSLGLDNP